MAATRGYENEKGPSRGLILSLKGVFGGCPLVIITDRAVIMLWRRSALCGGLWLLSLLVGTRGRRGAATRGSPAAWIMTMRRPMSPPTTISPSRWAIRPPAVATARRLTPSRWRLLAAAEGSEAAPEGSQEIIFEPDVEFLSQEQELELLGDQELLNKYREDRQKVNDQWQFNTFAGAQAGVWSGIWSEYVPSPSQQEGVVELKLLDTVKGRNRMEVDEVDRIVSWRDEVLMRAPDGGIMEPVVCDEQVFAPMSFRADNGAMAVDNAFTMSVTWKGESGDDMFAADIWLRWKDMRTRCRFIYWAPSPSEALKLSRIVVIKERLGKAGPTCEEPELFGTRGNGVYDRGSQAAGDWELNFPGGLCLSFPPVLPREDKATIIMDWTAGDMRFQGDRSVERPDGTLSGFSVTQISAKDSLVYLPEGSTPVTPQSEAE